MYAIRTRDTQRWFWGMDNKYDPPRPRLSMHRVNLYNTRYEAETHKPTVPFEEEFEVVIISYRIIETHGNKRKV